MNARSKKARGFKPALTDATPQDKGTVVSWHRFRWKLKHADQFSDPVIRMVRFVWMRRFAWGDRHALHAGVLGACLRAGLVTHRGGLLVATDTGEKLLADDRKEARS